MVNLSIAANVTWWKRQVEQANQQRQRQAEQQDALGDTKTALNQFCQKFCQRPLTKDASPFWIDGKSSFIWRDPPYPPNPTIWNKWTCGKSKLWKSKSFKAWTAITLDDWKLRNLKSEFRIVRNWAFPIPILDRRRKCMNTFRTFWNL